MQVLVLMHLSMHAIELVGLNFTVHTSVALVPTNELDMMLMGASTMSTELGEGE
jgi:hypothetical protein